MGWLPRHHASTRWKYLFFVVEIPEQNHIPHLRRNTRSRSHRLPGPLLSIKQTFLLLHHNRSGPLLNLRQPPGIPEVQRLQNRSGQIRNYADLLWSPVLHHARSFAPKQPPKWNRKLWQQTEEKILIQFHNINNSILHALLYYHHI